ncbi:hypothetical protein NL676_009854 [Syzygium grande]|nr:hypothetical protein NL676_009854 [Syzygium grande]
MVIYISKSSPMGLRRRRRRGLRMQPPRSTGGLSRLKIHGERASIDREPFRRDPKTQRHRPLPFPLPLPLQNRRRRTQGSRRFMEPELDRRQRR